MAALLNSLFLLSFVSLNKRNDLDLDFELLEIVILILEIPKIFSSKFFVSQMMRFLTERKIKNEDKKKVN